MKTMFYLLMLLGVLVSVLGFAIVVVSGTGKTNGEETNRTTLQRAALAVLVRFGFIVLLCGVALVWLSWAAMPAHSADLKAVPLPYEITHGHMNPWKRSLPHMRKRWRMLCAGGGRYEAMAEAYERNQPNPCQ